MLGGLFVTLYDEKSLALYLKYGVYGFLMKPVCTDKVSSRSKHFSILADYACTRKGSHVLFFLKRKIIYGGIISGNNTCASFYLNGTTSPLGIKAKAPLFWDESSRYKSTSKEGVFFVDEKEKAQPFMLLFDKVSNLTGKQISSDEFYDEVGQFPFPLPSNSIQGMGFCTLTPGETKIAIDLFASSEKRFSNLCQESMIQGEEKTIFHTDMIDLTSIINEANLEYSLIADLQPISKLLPDKDYVLCRQVPISPFKPYNMDRSDICLYSVNNPIRKGTLPNVVIELKRDIATYKSFNQVCRYMKWLQKVTPPEQFNMITPIIIANDFHIKLDKIEKDYLDDIILYSLYKNKAYSVKDLK
ncbi:MAG TPA: hypothetical protein PK581_00820 [Caldisericia bacterium]|nr:hypothetical protein [Caldisericia bacterium]